MPKHFRCLTCPCRWVDRCPATCPQCGAAYVRWENAEAFVAGLVRT